MLQSETQVLVDPLGHDPGFADTFNTWLSMHPKLFVESAKFPETDKEAKFVGELAPREMGEATIVPHGLLQEEKLELGITARENPGPEYSTIIDDLPERL